MEVKKNASELEVCFTGLPDHPYRRGDLCLLFAFLEPGGFTHLAEVIEFQLLPVSL